MSNSVSWNFNFARNEFLFFLVALFSCGGVRRVQP